MRALSMIAFLAACAPYAPSPRSAPAHVRSVVELAALNLATCALLSDGSVRCWGSWTSGEAQLEPTELAGFSRAVSIAAAGDRVCAIDDAARVACGTLASRARDVGVAGAIELALTEGRACARLESGDVVCWSDAQPKIVARGALQLVASNGRHAVRLDDGRVLAWGDEVEELDVDSVTQLFVTRHALCARLWDGSSWCSGIFGGDVPAQLTGDFVGSAGDCAWSAEGTVGCGWSGDAAIGALRNVVQVVAGQSHHCALVADGDVWCWGSNAEGQLGEQISATPRPIEVGLAARARAISVSSDVSCAAGPRSVFCWGELQHSMFVSRSPLRRAAAVQGDALAFNGAVVCGYSSDGVQCDGGGAFRLVRHDGSPLRITGDVVFADGLAAAVVDDGRAIWWRASLAPGKRRPAALVHDVTDIVELGYQERSWLALLKNGTVLAQRCGDQVCAPSSALALCPILEGVADLAARGKNACIVRDGRVACWGAAFEGTALECRSPKEPSWIPGVANATRVAVGAKHACALVEDGVACWGDNDWGQLGNGNFVTREEATRVSGLHDAVELALGDRHSCARLANGEVRCWGDIRFGQMGDGVRRIRSAPLRIRGI